MGSKEILWLFRLKCVVFYFKSKMVFSELSLKFLKMKICVFKEEKCEVFQHL